MKYPRRGIALGMAALLAIGLAACGSDKSDKLTAVVTVKADKAGTYSLGYVTVTAPAGAVKKDTQLKMTPTRSTNAPFGAASTQFDLSFDGGVEPAKPLDVSVKLPSKLPTDVVPEHALLYSASADGKGWSLVPGLVKDGRLHAQLTHLSPKIMVYPTDQQLLDAAGIKLADVGTQPNCKDSAVTSAGKVVFTNANQNWNNRTGSVINACLATDNDVAKLTVTSRINYMLGTDIPSSLNVSADAPSVDSWIVQKIARKAFPNSGIQSYLDHGSSFSVLLPPSKLPATIKLKSDPGPFLAEASWWALKFMITLVTGKGGNDAAELAKKIVDTPGKLDCITDALKSGLSPKPNMGEAFKAVTGACLDIVLEVAGDVFAGGNLWDSFWGRFGGATTGAIEGYGLVAKSLRGIELQFVGTVTVAVGLVRAKVEPTPTAARKLPEVCSQTTDYQNAGESGTARATITRGSVGCKEATKITKQFLESEIGSSGANSIGIWGCNFTYGAATDARCQSSRGEFLIKLL